jgi:hypothetical protein
VAFGRTTTGKPMAAADGSTMAGVSNPASWHQRVNLSLARQVSMTELLGCSTVAFGNAERFEIRKRSQ